MPEQTRRPKVAVKKEEKQVEAMPASSTSREDSLAELDALLDEVDEVLEENAEEMVKNYVQKGGE